MITKLVFVSYLSYSLTHKDRNVIKTITKQSLFGKFQRFRKAGLMKKSLSPISNALEMKSSFHFSKAYPFRTKTQSCY